MAEQLPTGQRGVASAPRVALGGPSPFPSGTEPSANIRDWLGVVRRHVVLAMGVTAAAVAVAAGIAFLTAPTYRATSVVRLVDARRALAGDLVSGGGLDVAVRSTNPVLSQVEVLRSRATAGAVVDDMPMLRTRTRGFKAAVLQGVHLAPNVQSDTVELRFGERTVHVQRRAEHREVAYGSPIEIAGIGFTVAERPTSQSGALHVISREAATTAVTRRLVVRPRVDTDVIDVSFISSDPRRAQQVANRVAEAFQAANAKAAQQEAVRRRQFIETQLRFNDSLLAEARQALTAFRALEPGSAADRSADPGSRGVLEARRAELDLERRQYASLLGRLQDTSSAARRAALRNVLAASPIFGGNAVVSRLYEQLVRYETLRDSLTTGDWARAATNPDVQRLEPLIAASEANLVGAVQSAVQGAIASLDARIGVLRDLEARSVATARRLSGVHATEEVLAERVENARRVADQLRAEYQEARIAEAVEVGQVEIVDRAPLPRVPIGVGRARILVFGLLLGLLLGGGSAALADHLNRSVHRREDIAQLGLPVLGVVPHAKAGATDGAAPIVEAMRGLRFNVLHAYGAAGPVLFTVTSPGSREGKSFVATNLALAFADAGHRTLLIDGDLRRGSLYKVLDARRKPGLTDVLHGEVPRDDVIQATRYPPLFFVGCGTRTPDAPELLGSEAMSQLIAGVRQTFGVIVVDSPPLGAGVDAYALGAVTGNVVLVLRMGSTDRAAAEAKLDLLERLPVRLLGTVLNDVPPHSAYSSYSYYLEGYAYEAEQGRQPRTLTGKGGKKA